MRAGSEEEGGNLEGQAPDHRKPANLLYSLEEVPPADARLGLAIQHVFVMSVGWIFVVVLVTAIGGSAAQTESVIRFSMIASGIATILQARSGLFGSGYLCPFSCGPAYLPAAILAGQAGGLPLIFGLTTISGVFEAALARAIERLRVLFPPEVTGWSSRWLAFS
jgi:xanthine permease XanP